MLSLVRGHERREPVSETTDDLAFDAFDAFARDARPRLERALLAVRGTDLTADAVSEALTYAWEHWSSVRLMENPVGYLYRVGVSRTRARRLPDLPRPESVGLPEVEPGLVPALRALPEQQRAAVWLVHACGWTHAEAAEAMAVDRSTVGTHVQRGMAALRSALDGGTS
jgi:RNA polymerase sigma-70 factor (ECF subfamily)